MHSLFCTAFAAFVVSTMLSPASAANGDSGRGQRVFNACAACHSLEPNRNMTGPSLAQLWNRKAGGLPSFERYSDVLKSSGIVWDDKTLDQWITDPQHLIPGNQMTFAGLKNPQQRADLLAFLKSQDARPRGSCSNHQLLPRHVSRDHRRREEARFLGAQSSAQDRRQRQRSPEGSAGTHRRRDDGRPRRRHLRRARGDQRIHQAGVLMRRW